MKTYFLFLLLIAVVSFPLFLLFFSETYLHVASMHLAMVALAAYLLWKKDLKTTLDGIGFPGSLKNIAVYYIGGLAALFALMLAFGIIATLADFNDQQKISGKLEGLPIYVLMLAIFLAPFSEELLFRASLVPRVGVLPAALLFGLMHLAYGSVVEIIGTFLVGLLLGLLYQRSKSITPCILVHLTYNALSLLAMGVL